MAGKKINLTDQLKNYFGFDTFKGNQEVIIQICWQVMILSC